MFKRSKAILAGLLVSTSALVFAPQNVQALPIQEFSQMDSEQRLGFLFDTTKKVLNNLSQSSDPVKQAKANFIYTFMFGTFFEGGKAGPGISMVVSALAEAHRQDPAQHAELVMGRVFNEEYEKSKAANAGNTVSAGNTAKNSNASNTTMPTL